MTFLPINIRLQEQTFGRVGRKGESDTWQLVFKIFKRYQKESINKLMKTIKQIASFEIELVRKDFGKKK